MFQQRSWFERNLDEAFFPVELRPVYVDRPGHPGAVKRLDRHLAVLDMDRGYTFAVVTDGYELVTNKMAYEMSADAMRKVFRATKIEDLACLNITMPNSRSFCHIDLIHKNSNFSPWKNDTWTAFLRITNSYNRTRRLRFELGFCRWICLNGMIFGAKSIDFSFAHTRRGVHMIDSFSENIGDIRKLETQLVEQLHQLKRFYVPKEEMLAIFCRAFGIGIEGAALENNQRVAKLREMKEYVQELTDSYFGDMGTHAYAALNVLTDFASRAKGVISAESAVDGFQQKASHWMEDFIGEISKPTFSFDAYLGRHRESAQALAAL